MISRAANRTSSERSSAASLRPSIRVLNFSRVRSDAGILSIGVLLRGGRSPNRTSLVRLIRRGCTPTLFPASLGLHPHRYVYLQANKHAIVGFDEWYGGFTAAWAKDRIMVWAKTARNTI